MRKKGRMSSKAKKKKKRKERKKKRRTGLGSKLVLSILGLKKKKRKKSSIFSPLLCTNETNIVVCVYSIYLCAPFVRCLFFGSVSTSLVLLYSCLSSSH
jgi:hypothetical protein